MDSVDSVDKTAVRGTAVWTVWTRLCGMTVGMTAVWTVWTRLQCGHDCGVVDCSVDSVDKTVVV